MRNHQDVFVDSGGWIALALSRDPFHERAVEVWKQVHESRAYLYTSVPVILETFTFLDRHARRDIAIAWKDSLEKLSNLEVISCDAEEMRAAWQYFTGQKFHKLSAVDATSFVLMARRHIKIAFAFDHHFTSAGFQLVG